MTIQVGDKVRALRTYRSVMDGLSHFTEDKLYTVAAVSHAPWHGNNAYSISVESDDQGDPNGMLNDPKFPFFEKVAAKVPSIADDLRLYPQDRTILAHLKRGKSISPMKALVVYGLPRLAAHIHNIRKIGYKVTNSIAYDEQGHKYSNYTLVTE